MSNPNKGAEFYFTDADGNEFEIPEVISVTPSNPTRPTYQDSHHKTEGAHTYKGEKLLEPGTLTVRINYLSGSDADVKLLAMLNATDPVAYRSVHNAAAGAKRQVAGNAILTGYAPQDMPITGKQEAVLTFQASGVATHGAAA
ncbi:phage tail tube protein [Sphingobium sp.]|uniref:phage tail tube protein n=1 Tax=Sphingobium sp. TaxID=1912891 RepID=UPI002E2472B6